jgi:TolB protein
MIFKSSFFSALCAALVYIAFFVSAEAQVKVVKRAIAGNPKLIFKGVKGSPAFNKQVASDLKNCGWFDMISSGKADYMISGSANPNSVTLSVYNGDGQGLFSASSVASKSGFADASHRAVDKILNKIFGIKGICASKIVFCLEPRKNVKNIYICDFDGKNFKRVTSTQTLCVEPDWFPDGRSIVYTMYRGASTDIVQTDLAMNRSRRLAFFPGLNSGGAISPDGKKLAMILSRGKRVDLYVKYIVGRGIKMLTKSNYSEASPCWSPNGSQICFVSDAAGSPKLYVIGANGGRYKRLPSVGIESVSPDWASDGKIVYSAKMGRNYSIAVYDPSGKISSGNIISLAGDWESPSWAPDNRHVVCSRKLNGNSSIYIIDSWTGKTKRLLGGKYNLSMPSWSPEQ